MHYGETLKELLFHRLDGENARAFTQDIAQLRLKVFHEFPYLYEGSLDYEKQYLETYFKAKHSFIFLVEDEGNIVGASTSIWAPEEEESFRKPFEVQGMNPESIFYFGESVLLPEYRGTGLGKIFFNERENFAKSLPFVKTVSFCTVVREENHKLRPENYKPLNDFWNAMGFTPAPHLSTNYEWLDRDESIPSLKKMQYWIKNIRE